jgi:hypothetical protein
MEALAEIVGGLLAAGLVYSFVRWAWRELREVEKFEKCRK